jgi:replicative DNA helicase
MKRIAQALEGKVKRIRWLVIPGVPQGSDAADYKGETAALGEYITDEAPEEAGLASPLVMLADRVAEATAELDRLHVGDWSRYIPTGIQSLDRKVGAGLKRGEITLIGGSTGAGKTTLVVQMAIAASEKGLAVIVSPEMSAEALVTREIVRRSGYSKWDRASWQPNAIREAASREHARAASEILQNPPNVAIFDSLDANLDVITDAIKKRAEKESIAFVALDYAQQLADLDDKARYLAVGQVAFRAIELSRELNCHVVITSQLNTIREGKDGKERRYTFRESAILEQKASNAMFFIVERDEKMKPISARFEATKVRDNALFRLEVDYSARTYEITDKEQQPEAVPTWGR